MTRVAPPPSAAPTGAPPRWLLLLLLATIGAVLLATALTVRPRPGAARADEGTPVVLPVPAGSGIPVAGPRDVLARWDAQRSQAWARGDPVALGRLYAPGSAAGRADVAMLRRWTARGMRVTGVRMRVLTLRADAASPGRMVLRVVDQEVGATARPLRPGGPGVPFEVRLPRDQPTRHRLALVRVRDGPWRMASVG